MKPVVIARRARQEIEAAAAFHEKEKPGLGAEFTERIAEAVERIGLAPEGYRIVYGDLRRVTLRKFKDFGLWFRIFDGQLGCCRMSQQSYEPANRKGKSIRRSAFSPSQAVKLAATAPLPPQGFQQSRTGPASREGPVLNVEVVDGCLPFGRAGAGSGFALRSWISPR